MAGRMMREVTIVDANGRLVIAMTSSVEEAYVPPFTWTTRDLTQEEEYGEAIGEALLMEAVAEENRRNGKFTEEAGDA